MYEHCSSCEQFGPWASCFSCCMYCKMFKINFLFQKSIVAGKSLCLKKVLSCNEWSLSREDRELQLINWSYKRMLHWFIVKFSGSFLVDTKVFQLIHSLQIRFALTWLIYYVCVHACMLVCLESSLEPKLNM